MAVIYFVSESTQVLQDFAQPCDQEMFALIRTELVQFKFIKFYFYFLTGITGNTYRKFPAEQFPARWKYVSVHKGREITT